MTAKTETRYFPITIKQVGKNQLLDILVECWVKAELGPEDQQRTHDEHALWLLWDNFTDAEILGALAAHHEWPSHMQNKYPDAYVAHRQKWTADDAKWQLDQIVAGAGNEQKP